MYVILLNIHVAGFKAWGIAELVSAYRRAEDSFELVPSLLLEYKCNSRQGLARFIAVSRSLTALDTGERVSTARGVKKSSFLATESSLLMVVADADSKLWFIEAVF